MLAYRRKTDAAAVQSTQYIDAITTAGLVSDYLPAAKFAQFMAEQSQLWGVVIPAAGIKIQ